MKPRQEVLNVLVAELLNKLGIVAKPEHILYTRRSRKMPDVLVDLRGLRVAIEGEFDTTPSKRAQAINSAWRRVEDGIAHIGIALIYPVDLREDNLTPSELRDALDRGEISFAIVTESNEKQAQLSIFGDHSETGFTATEFSEGSIVDLAESLRRAYEHLSEESLLLKAVTAVEDCMEDMDRSLADSPATSERIADILGVD